MSSAVADRGIEFAEGCLRPETRGGKTERLEDPLVDQLLPRLAGRRFDHRAGDHVAEVGVLERRAGRCFGLVRLPGFERLHAEVAEVEVERVDVEVDARDLLAIGWNAAGVRQKLLQRNAASAGFIPWTLLPRTSPMVESHRSLPSSTIMPASVAVMALVSEPRWKRSSTVTGTSVPSA
jgi:hypothetical protein